MKIGNKIDLKKRSTRNLLVLIGAGLVLAGGLYSTRGNAQKAYSKEDMSHFTALYNALDNEREDTSAYVESKEDMSHFTALYNALDNEREDTVSLR